MARIDAMPHSVRGHTFDRRVSVFVVAFVLVVFFFLFRVLLLVRHLKQGHGTDGSVRKETDTRGQTDRLSSDKQQRDLTQERSLAVGRARRSFKQSVK